VRAAPERATAWIAATLKWGSYLSAALMLVGTMLVLRETDRPIQVGPAMPLRLLPGQFLDANPYAIMQAGVLLLLLTPLVRLLMAAVSFWMERERRYTLVSLAVLTIILASLFLSRGG
jgi:uncharacterized membrane protein